MTPVLALHGEDILAIAGVLLVWAVVRRLLKGR